ncbi:hypothetical protein [Thalassotalea fusca]
MKKVATILTVLLAVLYPFVVYVGLQVMAHQLLAALLAGVFIVRSWLYRHTPTKAPWMNAVTFIAIGILSATVLFDIEIGVMVYPIAVNLVMLTVFTWSLVKKPCVIETLARMQEPDLSEKGVRYTEKVTVVWAIFFAVNAMVSTATMWLGDLSVWTLYNGLIAYILMGTLMLIEWCVRQKVKAEH